MKSSIQIALPISILLFNIFTVWTYGIVIDGTDEFLFGFPLIQNCRGFHTSLSSQYFILESLFNFSCYFSLVLLITISIQNIWRFNVPKILLQIFWGLLLVYTSISVYISIQSDDRYLLKRDFEIVPFKKGISIMNNHPDRSIFAPQLEQRLSKQNMGSHLK